MAEVKLYYQERADGGQRSGLYVDGEPALGAFVPGGGDPDPKLLWYVDLTWEADPPPETQEDARTWIADRGDNIRAVLGRTAEELASGIDVDFMPWQWECSTSAGPVRVSVSAMRRFAAVEIGRRLRGLAAKWGDVQPALSPVG